jgi:cell division protease FtsH
VIDEEVAKFLHTAEDLAKRTIQQHVTKMNALADALLERETLDEDEIRELLGPSVYDKTGRVAPAGPARVASVRE